MKGGEGGEGKGGGRGREGGRERGKSMSLCVSMCLCVCLSVHVESHKPLIFRKKEQHHVPNEASPGIYWKNCAERKEGRKEEEMRE